MSQYLSLCLPISSTLKDPFNYTGPTWIIQNNLLFFKVSLLLATLILPLHVTYHRFQGLGSVYLLRGCYSTYHSSEEPSLNAKESTKMRPEECYCFHSLICIETVFLSSGMLLPDLYLETTY